MKRILLQIILGAIFISSYSQMKVIDSNIIARWPTLYAPKVSNNGDYFSCQLSEGNSKDKLQIFKVKKGIIFEAENSSQLKFSENNQFAIYSTSPDTLNILNLKTLDCEHFSDLLAFSTITINQKEFLVYKSNSNCLTIINLSSNRRYKIENVETFVAKNNIPYIFFSSIDSVDKKTTISYINIITPSIKHIWKGSKINNLIVCNNGSKLAFIESLKPSNNTDTSEVKNIVCINTKKQTTSQRISLDMKSNDNSYPIKIILKQFSADGESLFFTTIKQIQPFNKIKIPSLDIWHYEDAKLQSQQLADKISPQNGNIKNSYMLNIEKAETIQLTNNNEELYIYDTSNFSLGIIQRTYGGDITEINWNPHSRRSHFLTNLKAGIKDSLQLNNPDVSPEGKYIIGTDLNLGNINNGLIVYNIKSNTYRNITNDLLIEIGEGDQGGPIKHKGFQVLSWLKGDLAVLVYDKYDIWQLDPEGIKPPINVTNGQGRKYNTIFRVPLALKKNTYQSNEIIILSSFNTHNKENGFYSVKLGTKEPPQKLYMGPFLFDAIPSSDFFYISKILKAKAARIFIVQKQSSTQFPNYYFTSNFKQFFPITNTEPNCNINWLESNLVTFKTSDNNTSQGILYKPKNFDSTKKYPLIINFYETSSDKLNYFFTPQLINGNIDIPWFISREYLVFTPDIHYMSGRPLESALIHILSGLRHIIKLPYVDSLNIGIAGHSWGAIQLNYILTHTNKFKAAVSSSGGSNWISGYGSIMLSKGLNEQFLYEIGQNRIGGTLWDSTLQFIENSPILKANLIATPILMMNNKNDGIVSFSQGIELFTALRRLGKKVWMLQYDKGTHSLSDIESKYDYTIRVTQFFDHFLKNKPVPEWLKNGIPAAKKGVVDGLNLIP